MRPLSIGVTCYPTFGGSGIVATEIGVALARRGHRIHFIASDLPQRLDTACDNVFFHQVVARDYPVFPHAPYALALASSMIRVAQFEGLDVLHVHYAVPHATSAWMAGQVLGPGRPRIVTTLHGTDITLVGADESLLPITRHSILHSDALSTPSAFLRDETWRRLDLSPAEAPIAIIPNFVDPERFFPADTPHRPRLTALFGPEAAHTPTLVHVSNFRRVKRVDRVVEVFARLAAQTPAFLLLIGDGPERPAVEHALRAAGLWHRARLLGKQQHFEALLRECALFVLPSETESFGLAALEALASGVPVVASAVGGLPEVIREGETGALVVDGDPAGMAAKAAELLATPARHAACAAAARADAVARFRPEPAVDAYLALYGSVLGGAVLAGAEGAGLRASRTPTDKAGT